MKAIKRSASYRSCRPLIGAPAPVDVWDQRPDGAYIALFPAASTNGIYRSFIGFAVDRGNYELIRAGRLDITVDSEGWRAINVGLASAMEKT